MARRAYMERFLDQLEAYKDTEEAQNSPELAKMIISLGECLKRINSFSISDYEDITNHRHRVFGAYTEKAAW